MSSLYSVHKSIPTSYAGVLFRSRLEARWAAWFDLVGWQWDYEPLDLDGWAPDFSITGNGSPIFVEVKPVSWKAGPTLPLEDYTKAVREDVDVLLLGLGPIEKDGYGYIGMCNDLSEGPSRAFEPAVCQDTYQDGAQFGYCSAIQSFHDRLSGYYEGGSWDGRGHALVAKLWREAGSKTQWRGCA